MKLTEEEKQKIVELRNNPETVHKIVQEILNTFYPDDDFIVKILKRLSVELEDRQLGFEIAAVCSKFISNKKELVVSKEDVERARKLLGV